MVKMVKPLSIIELIEYAGDRESDEAPEGRRRKHLRGAISMGLPLKGTSLRPLSGKWHQAYCII